MEEETIERIRKIGYSGFVKNVTPKFAAFKDEDWMSLLSYLFVLYDPTMAMDGKSSLAASQKQVTKNLRILDLSHKIASSGDFKSKSKISLLDKLESKLGDALYTSGSRPRVTHARFNFSGDKENAAAGESSASAAPPSSKPVAVIKPAAAAATKTTLAADDSSEQKAPPVKKVVKRAAPVAISSRSIAAEPDAEAVVISSGRQLARTPPRSRLPAPVTDDDNDNNNDDNDTESAPFAKPLFVQQQQQIHQPKPPQPQQQQQHRQQVASNNSGSAPLRPVAVKAVSATAASAAALTAVVSAPVVVAAVATESVAEMPFVRQSKVARTPVRRPDGFVPLPAAATQSRHHTSIALPAWDDDVDEAPSVDEIPRKKISKATQQRRASRSAQKALEEEDEVSLDEPVRQRSQPQQHATRSAHKSKPAEVESAVTQASLKPAPVSVAPLLDASVVYPTQNQYHPFSYPPGHGAFPANTAYPGFYPPAAPYGYGPTNYPNAPFPSGYPNSFPTSFPSGFPPNTPFNYPPYYAPMFGMAQQQQQQQAPQTAGLDATPSTSSAPPATASVSQKATCDSNPATPHWTTLTAHLPPQARAQLATMAAQLDNDAAREMHVRLVLQTMFPDAPPRVSPSSSSPKPDALSEELLSVSAVSVVPAAASRKEALVSTAVTIESGTSTVQSPVCFENQKPLLADHVAAVITPRVFSPAKVTAPVATVAASAVSARALSPAQATTPVVTLAASARAFSPAKATAPAATVAASASTPTGEVAALTLLKSVTVNSSASLQVPSTSVPASSQVVSTPLLGSSVVPRPVAVQKATGTVESAGVRPPSSDWKALEPINQMKAAATTLLSSVGPLKEQDAVMEINTLRLETDLAMLSIDFNQDESAQVSTLKDLMDKLVARRNQLGASLPAEEVAAVELEALRKLTQRSQSLQADRDGIQASLADAEHRFLEVRARLESQAQRRAQDIETIRKYNQKLHAVSGITYKSPARSPGRAHAADEQSDAKQSLRRAQLFLEKRKAVNAPSM